MGAAADCGAFYSEHLLPCAYVEPIDESLGPFSTMNLQNEPNCYLAWILYVSTYYCSEKVVIDRIKNNTPEECATSDEN